MNDKYCKTCVSGDAAIIRVNGTKDRPISNADIILTPLKVVMKI